MMRAIVLSNGELDQPAVLRARLDDWRQSGEAVQVVAADGGSHHAEALGLRPDVVIGDLDSLDEAARDALSADGARFETVPARKDETDLELALLYAVEQGAGEIVALGVLGGRLDMTLANILLLTHPGLDAARIEIWTGWQTAWIVRPPGDTVSGQRGDTLSLIPLGGDAVGVTTRGLEYPLKGERLRFGPARGVSNVLAAPDARVDLGAGMLLAVHTPGRA
jgi:thiamine pyrophosphokinase